MLVEAVGVVFDTAAEMLVSEQRLKPVDRVRGCAHAQVTPQPDSRRLVRRRVHDPFIRLCPGQPPGVAEPAPLGDLEENT